MVVPVGARSVLPDFKADVHQSAKLRMGQTRRTGRKTWTRLGPAAQQKFLAAIPGGERPSGRSQSVVHLSKWQVDSILSIYVPEEVSNRDLHDSFEFMLPLVQKVGAAFLLAGPTLSLNPGLALHAIRGGCPFARLQIELQKNYLFLAITAFDMGDIAFAEVLKIYSEEKVKEAILKMMKDHWEIYQKIAPLWNDEEEYMEKLLTQNSQIYPLLSDRLLADEDLFVIASQDHPQLAFANTKLPMDRQVYIFKTHLGMNEEYIAHLSSGLIDDGRVIDLFIEKYPDSKLRNFPRWICKILEMAENRCEIFEKLAGEKMKSTENSAKSFLDVDGYILKHLTEELRKNLSVVIRAAKKSPESFQYALIESVESIVQIFEEVPAIFPYIPQELQNHPQIIALKLAECQESNGDEPPGLVFF